MNITVRRRRRVSILPSWSSMAPAVTDQTTSPSRTCVPIWRNTATLVESIENFTQTAGAMGPIHDDDIANWPIFVREVESGIDALGKNPAVDPNRIGLVGFSLGAYLSLAIGAQEPHQIAAIVDYYGKLVPHLEPLAKNLPPTLIMHGSFDEVVPVASAHRLDSLMTNANRPHETHIYPGLGHGFNFQRSSLCPADPCLRFLTDHLHPDADSGR